MGEGGGWRKELAICDELFFSCMRYSDVFMVITVHFTCKNKSEFTHTHMHTYTHDYIHNTHAHSVLNNTGDSSSVDYKGLYEVLCHVQKCSIGRASFVIR